MEELVGASCDRGWAPIRVAFHAGSPGPGRQRVVIEQQYAHRVEVATEVSVSDDGTAETIVYAPPGWCGSQLCVGAGDERTCEPIPNGGPAADVLVLQDELELRPALSMASAPPDVRTEGTGRSLSVRVARRRGDDGTHLLPDRAVGYGSLRAVVAEAPVLDRLERPEREALASWVRGGGVLVAVALEAEQLASSELLARDLLGTELLTAKGQLVSSDRGPTLTPVRPYTSGRWPSEVGWPGLHGITREICGVRANVGLGALLLTVPTSEPGSYGLETQLTACLTSERLPSGVGWSAARIDASSARSGERLPYGLEALDPNRTDRPPTWAYLLVVTLFLSGLVVVERRWARQRQGSVSRLVLGVSAVSLVGTLALFGLGQASRGLGARYRAASTVDLGEGASEGALTRHLAVHFDGPGRLSLPLDDEALAFTRDGELRLGDDGSELQLAGRRWETVTVLETGVAHVEGSVSAERNEVGRIASVRNDLAVPIRRAFLVDDGAHLPVTPVRDIAAGATVSVSPAAPLSRSGLPESYQQAIHGSVGRGERTLVGEVDLGCPRRGELRGERCSTTLVVRLTP